MQISDLPDSKRFKRLLLAVSGGLDSMCLAHYFVHNQLALGIEWLGIAHVHHGLRGSTADRDADFVARFAFQSRRPFYIRYLNGAALKQKGSIEENARLARYAALKEIAALPEVRADYILTAHHANDQAETVLMRILRGSSWKGLCSIQTVREDGVFRPLLPCTKADLKEYAEENHIEYVEDETNADESFARNAIRNRFLPILNAEISSLTNIAKLSTSLCQKIRHQSETAIRPFVLPPKLWPFPKESSPYETVIAIHQQVLVNLSLKSLNGGAEIFRFWLQENGFAFPRSIQFLSSFSSRDAELIFEKSKSILWFCQNKKKEEPATPAGFRKRKNGDFCIPAGRPPKKLGKWMEEEGIPAFVRDFIPLYAEENRIFQIGKIHLGDNR